MSNQPIIKKITMPDGKEISIETGRLARQADGAVVVRMGNTMLLATVVSDKDAMEGVDFLPLTVEYKEKYAAAGRFPGGFLKRENRPSDYEILISRLVDRALRPLFPDDYHANTQVMISLISAEKNVYPDVLACLGAAAAIAVSDIPFNGPVSEVRVGRVDGQFIVNPTITEIEQSDIDIMLAGTATDVVMLEGEMKEIQEADMVEAIRFGHEAIKIQCQALNELSGSVAKASPKREYNHETHDNDLRESVRKFAYDKVYQIAKSGQGKHERREAFRAVREEFMATLGEEERAAKEGLVSTYFHDVEKEAVRAMILNDRTRLDGRSLDQIRPIWTEIDYLPGAHGSAIFTRGETQSLTSVTLGTKLDEQMVDSATIKGSEKFILHYNFPGFSTGEAKPIRGTSRREIGHGNLALRALKNQVPRDESNPYTIRVVSDILESNGSSSMATVCAGSLALMDAGVKMKSAVSGIAMGLITDGSSGKYAVLSDILGDEDHLGDMDFKVCGTENGITACQMDIKVNGLSFQVLTEALEQAKKGRLHILGEMKKTITEPRQDYKAHVPRIEQITIPKEFIGAVIGPGGKIIQEIQRETNTVIVLEEKGDLGVIDISSENKEGIDAAKERIKRITAIPEVGEVYTGKVKSIMPFGAFVEILPGKDGLLHISEIEWRRLENVESVLKEGEIIQVKLIEVDKKTGKLKLSRKVLLPKPEKQQEPS